MSIDRNVKENIENVNNNFENDMKMEELKKILAKKFEEYEKTMKYLLADAPIQILNLDKLVEKILLDNGLLRVYDLFDVDFIKIKGFGAARLGHLTTRLNEFFSML